MAKQYFAETLDGGRIMEVQGAVGLIVEEAMYIANQHSSDEG